MASTSPSKTSHLAKTLIERASAALRHLKLQKPLTVPRNTISHPSIKPQDNSDHAHPSPNLSISSSSSAGSISSNISQGSYSIHGSSDSSTTWPIAARSDRLFPAPARVHSSINAFGRHYGTFSGSFHPRHEHISSSYHLQHHLRHHHRLVVQPSIANVIRIALGARAFVGSIT